MGTAAAAAVLTGLVTLLIPRSAIAEWPLWTANAAEGAEVLVHDPGLVLLEAAVNPDPNPTKGGQVLVVSEGSALLATSGVGLDSALEKIEEEVEAEAPREEKKVEEVKPAPKPKPARKPATPAKKAPVVKKIPAASGYFGNPVPGGRRSQGIHGNNAVDLSAPSGTPIYAAASGRVSVAHCDGGYNSGWGNYIKISHGNGAQTLYAHMSRCATSGGSVAKGQLIGYVGNTGKSTGNHLHFEVHGARNPL